MPSPVSLFLSRVRPALQVTVMRTWSPDWGEFQRVAKQVRDDLMSPEIGRDRRERHPAPEGQLVRGEDGFHSPAAAPAISARSHGWIPRCRAAAPGPKRLRVIDDLAESQHLLVPCQATFARLTTRRRRSS